MDCENVNSIICYMHPKIWSIFLLYPSPEKLGISEKGSKGEAALENVKTNMD